MLAAAPAYAQNTAFEPVGNWEALDDDGKTIAMVFDKEGFVTMKKGDEIIGGKEFVMEGNVCQMTYTFNTALSQYDFIIRFLETNEERVLMGIYKLLSPTEIMLAMSPVERPEDIETADNIIFKKIQ